MRGRRCGEGEYDRAKNTIPLELEVTEGPRVQIAVTGVKISQGQLKKLVPVYQEGSVDVDLLEEGKRNIRERLERDGYFDAEVDYATATKEVQQSGGWKGTEEVITYKVERGDRHKLVGIEITGNHYFDTGLAAQPAADLRRRVCNARAFQPAFGGGGPGFVAELVSVQRFSGREGGRANARQLQRDVKERC